MTDETDVSSVINKHFVNSVRCLAEKGGCSEQVLDIKEKKDPLDNTLTRFHHHSSITAIKQKGFTEEFDFTLFATVSSEINKLDPTKSTTGVSIRLLK